MKDDNTAVILARTGIGILLTVSAITLWLTVDGAHGWWEFETILGAAIILISGFLAYLFWRFARHAESAARLSVGDARQPSPSAIFGETTPADAARKPLALGDDQYRLLFDESPLPIWAYDLETLRFLVVNRVAQERYGYSEAEFLQMTIRDIRPPEDIPALEADVPPGLGTPPRADEWRHRLKNGRIIDVLVSAHDIVLHDRGARLITVQDITERKRAERELLASEARFRTLAESLPQLVWMCHADGYCDYLSRQWVEFTGRPMAEQLGRGWIEQVHPDDRPRLHAEWEQATSRGDSFDIEIRLRRFDGHYHWFKTRVLPLRDASDAIVKWFGSNTDIEELKQATQKLQLQPGVRSDRVG